MTSWLWPGRDLTPLVQIAKDFGISEGSLTNWMKRADIADGQRPSPTDADCAELRELKKRNRLLEQENEVLRRAAAALSGPYELHQDDATLVTGSSPTSWPMSTASPSGRTVSTASAASPGSPVSHHKTRSKAGSTGPGVAEGKLYICAIKDVFSNKIGGYSIDSRMKSS